MQDPVVLHVLVVGFHHKKGCQVEFAFPPLCPDAPESQGLELPDQWKHLPSLALPDGAHNYQKDTIYFHLPSLEEPRQTIYGVSCFRQMSSERLKNRGEDVTRGSVQKSVCVLSLLPLYGLIQTKLELITHAYFEERDFSQVALLEETYRHLNATLSSEQLWGSQLFLGLSVRDLILQFKHKVLVLFKLFLLERKVLFYKSPVEELCSTILTVCSLFPGMLERGLVEATSGFGRKDSLPEVKNDTGCVKTAPETQATHEKEDIDRSDGSWKTTSTFYVDQTPESIATNQNTDIVRTYTETDNVVNGDSVLETNSIPNDVTKSKASGPSDKTCDRVVESRSGVSSGGDVYDDVTVEDELMKEIDEVLMNGRDEDVKKVDLSSLPSTSSLVTLDLESCGLPLAIFTKGSVCLPYLSLPFIDSVSSLNMRSCVVGATNVLFKQKRNLFDVIVEIESGKIEVFDLELNKQLNLTIEDLRFAENLVQHVTGENKDVFLDGTGWEGGDEWLRGQFRIYLLSLLKTADAKGVSKDQESFNLNFIQAWQETHNFKLWQSNRASYGGLLQAEAKHPYLKPQISMADMKLKLSHSIQSTEKGRKINQAVTSTGKAVMQTGRVVGGALTSARSFMSSWLSNTNSPVPPQTATDKSPEMEMKMVRNEAYTGEIDDSP